MTAISTFARMLGIRGDLAEDALHSDRAARAALSRRSLFAAAGAMAGGSVFSFGEPAKFDPQIMIVPDGVWVPGTLITFAGVSAMVLRIHGETDHECRQRIKRLLAVA